SAYAAPGAAGRVHEVWNGAAPTPVVVCAAPGSPERSDQARTGISRPPANARGQIEMARPRSTSIFVSGAVAGMSERPGRTGSSGRSTSRVSRSAVPRDRGPAQHSATGSGGPETWWDDVSTGLPELAAADPAAA